MKPFCYLTAAIIVAAGCSPEKDKLPDHHALAAQYFNTDAQWYEDNIPFFECSDKKMEQVYYYRWKMYKAHIRNTRPGGFVITEFINDVTWDRDPFSTINAATMHHIYEGRWLKDQRYMNGYIHYMFQEGGNNRSYSESIADAAWARYLVNTDAAFITAQLDSMKHQFNLWYDHYDSSKHLYYIPSMPDATEYTIASIDASNGTAGFDGGDAFRPTINSYMYGNAMAISKIAALKGDSATSREYFQKAVNLKSTIQKNLWNDSLHHFTDRFKQNNQYVHYWDFIRGRELAGMIPWYFNLPADSPVYNAAWKHVLDTNQLLGKYGLRTNEPSYQFYFKQFVYNFGQRGSQWNGPSWPYQTSQVITGMANFLNDYSQDVVTSTDYVKMLRLFTQQHFLPDGKIDLVENYDPNNGGPIVYFYWSNHYNHSSYNNLVISGLCGIRPSVSDTLTIHPLVDTSISYFYLGDLLYHGHTLSVVYDRNGNKYHVGKGLTVYVDGKKANVINKNDKTQVYIGLPSKNKTVAQSLNYALNIRRTGFPTPAASVNTAADSIYQAVDGRIWYFTEITNRWTTEGSTSKTDWYSVDFGQRRDISMLKVYPVADGKTFDVPDESVIEYSKNGQWMPVTLKEPSKKLTGNTVNTILFDKISADAVRCTFKHTASQVAISEIECY